MRVGPYPVWIEVWGFTGHPNIAHQMIFNSEGHYIDIEYEAAAEEFAETVAHCSPDKHEGRGAKHSEQEIEIAYKEALRQLQETDYAAEWEEIQRLQRRYAKWGGAVPEAILMPVGDPQDWKVMLVDKEGNPVLYNMREQIAKEMQDITAGRIAKPDPTGFGFMDEEAIKRARLIQRMLRSRQR